MSAKLLEYKSALENGLKDKSKPWTQCLEVAEAKTGVDRLYLFSGGVVFVALYLVFGFGGQLVCNLIGFVYPAYMSVKAIESPKKDDDTKWLTYWVVYALFSIVEFFSDFIVGWFPLYWLIKCLFIVWCFVPFEINGSLFIYRRIIRPYYLKHHSHIDNLAETDVRTFIKKVSRKIDRGIDEQLDRLDDAISRAKKEF